MSDAKRAVQELIRHFDDLQIYASGVSKEAENLYGETEAAILLLLYEIFEALGNGKIADNYQSSAKLAELMERISEIRYNAEEKVLEMLEKEAAETIKEENFFWLLFFAFLAIGGRNISTETIDNIIRHGKYHGLTRRQIVDKVARDDVNRIYEAIANGLDRNDPVSKIKEELKRIFRNTRRFISAETDTILHGVADDAALAFAAKNKTDLRYTAVLDKKTCGECLDFDGNVYPANSPDIPYLPRHVNCRCILVPLANKEVNDELEKMDFKKYIDQLPADEQKKRLGESMYQKYLHGELEISGYIPPEDALKMSLEDITGRDKAAFA